MSARTATGVVRFSETDASGRFHYASALMWAENVEHALYREHGIAVTAFPRRAVSAEFHRPLADGDEYTVQLGVERLGGTSITYVWSVLRGDDTAVTGSHTVVHIGPEGGSAPLPEPLREALTPLVTTLPVA